MMLDEVFSDAPHRPGGFSGVALIDHDKDGDLDIYVTNGPGAANGFIRNELRESGQLSFSDISQISGAAATDLDILYHGAMDLNAIITHDNPGNVLENQECSGQFTQNIAAFRGDYTLRGTQGVAVGDLDRDGYIAVVTASNHQVDPAIPFLVSPAQYGLALDGTANFYLPMLADPGTGLWNWGGIEALPSDISVEINNGEGKDAVTFVALGSVGLTDSGRVNRSGIGAIMQFKPHRGRTSSTPIVGGSSFVSQHAIEAHFGLGTAKYGTLDITWPGGIRNRLYHVRAGEQLTIPEIPCSIDSDQSFTQHLHCVRHALGDLIEAGMIEKRFARRLLVNNFIAFLQGRP